MTIYRHLASLILLLLLTALERILGLNKESLLCQTNICELQTELFMTCLGYLKDGKEIYLTLIICITWYLIILSFWTLSTFQHSKIEHNISEAGSPDPKTAFYFRISET
jgi:hypothetical protein